MDDAGDWPRRLSHYVARRVREARIQRGLTQEQAAEKGGFSIGHWRQIERGGVDLRLSTIARAARVLDVAPFFLLMAPHGATPKRPVGRPKKRRE